MVVVVPVVGGDVGVVAVVTEVVTITASSCDAVGIVVEMF